MVFDNIHPEDSIKMSIKLYPFIEQKNRKLARWIPFKCDNSYNKCSRQISLKDEMEKPLEW
jgi:hypothetical protein